MFKLLKITILFSVLLNCDVLHSQGFSACDPAASAALVTIVAAVCPPAAPIVLIGEVIIGGIFVSIGFHSVYKLFKKNKHNANLSKQDWNIEGNLNFGGAPDPDDKHDVFENIKLKADKKIRSKRFGNFYRDPYTKLWWSKDRAGHAGSSFKVFKEHAKGLEWLFDADALGNPIVGKHKGSVGLFIPYKDLIPCA
jgi:hypothetical protein